MISPALSEQVASLAMKAGLGTVGAIEPFVGGANNRVFRLETEGGKVLLKAYFRHPDDPRDRLGTEFAFARFAWASGVRCLPQPYACDLEAGLALFEYVPGRGLRSDEVDDAAVDQALGFYRDLNRNKFHADAAQLPLASEACFSLEGHLDCIQRRVERLTALPVASDVDQMASDFVASELLPAWREVALGVRRQAAVRGLSLPAELELPDRILSPSDFGYHNALLAADGQLRFIDFEYAGWDDPAKLIGDFFCQPAIPAPPTAFPRFARAVAATLPRPDVHIARAEVLLPVYRVKWCCIVLNEFLPVGGRRRQFSAGPATEQQERKVRQLEKARQALAALRAGFASGRQVA
jgi:hypothetical protein